MNFNKAGKYLSLTLLVLGILSTSVGISVAAGENSSSTEAVDFNNYTSYYNCSSAVNVDHKPTSNLTKNLTSFNTNGTISGTSFNLNNHTNSSDKDSVCMMYSVLSNEDPVNLNVSQAFSEHLFNVSGFDKYWDELIELEFGLHKFRAIKLIISNPLKNIHKLNKKVQKNSDFENFNKNLLDNFSTVDLYKNELYKNKYILINKIYIFNSKNNSKNNSKIYANKLSTSDNHSSYDNNNDNDENEPSDSINLGNRFISYFNSFKTSNEFYKILDNNNSYGKIIPLESSNFNIIKSYSIKDYFSNEIKNKYTVINENQIKNNNSLFYIFNSKNNSKNNSKIHANKLPIPESHSSDDNDNDEDEPSDSINLGNRFIFYFNSFKTLNEFYKILDNTKFYGNLTPLETSTFKILEYYSTNTDYFSNETTSFEIVDIRNDSINFGIITDYLNLLNTDYSILLNYTNYVINPVLLFNFLLLNIYKN